MGLYVLSAGHHAAFGKSETLTEQLSAINVAVPYDFQNVRPDSEQVHLCLVRNTFFEAVMVVCDEHDYARIVNDASGRPTAWFVAGRERVVEQLKSEGISDERLRNYGLVA